MLNKPIYVRFTVLELSKYLMYDFHYNFTTDTDSLTYEIKSKDVYEDTYLTLVSINQTFLIQQTEKLLAKLKMNLKEFQSINLLDENKKCIVSGNGKEVKTKGVNISFEFEECEKVLLNKKLIRHKMKRIQSKLHKVGRYDVYKISLSCFDDQRYILGDGITTFTYFHKDLDD